MEWALAQVDRLAEFESQEARNLKADWQFLRLLIALDGAVG